MNRSARWFVLVLTLLALAAVTGAALADGPIPGRAGRAEVRFLEGMIDHHQMALDMANHCLDRASTDEVRALCEAVIAAQTPEIEQMQGWLLDWYGIDYQPMVMVSGGNTVDHSQHEAEVAEPASSAGGMCSMMGGEGCAMMESMDMGSMMGGEMSMPMMQMQMMMGMQMQMMQMMMMHMGMGMGGMEGMPGMSGMSGMSEMGGMSGMGGAGGSEGMPGMGAMPAAQATPTPDHSAHHPAAEATAMPEMGAMPGMDMGTVVTDPAMTMGMMAGFDRLTGLDYDLAWL
ncbi:MAG TPA: DUF305 domain-containing protein, partial [Candidatus Limnocylindrales bacterium]|nr:DUF305 domain-containing protein [Candidatus Limnocylindrales bacterium]